MKEGSEEEKMAAREKSEEDMKEFKKTKLPKFSLDR